MASLVTVKGPNPGQSFPLQAASAMIGRQPEVDIYLESLAVSRQHARILCQQGSFFIEDVGSSNGTYVNGQRIEKRRPLFEGDTLQIGPYLLAVRPDPSACPTEREAFIQARVEAHPGNRTLLSTNAVQKLQVVLEIAQHLGHKLEKAALLNHLLEQLFRLFPQADRGVVLSVNGDQHAVEARRDRQPRGESEVLYSRTVVRRVLEERVGILSQDVGTDPQLTSATTVALLGIRSLLCVPLLVGDRILGVIQLDCTRPGQSFRREDLEMLAAVAIQVAAVLENAALYEEQRRKDRLIHSLEMARDIQQAFLPTNFAEVAPRGLEVFARVQPALEVSGDFYDLFALPDGRLAFFIGDVCGKGMPAALFMFHVRTLIRHLAPSAASPADLLGRLNASLVADNPTALFVTLAHGVVEPDRGAVTFVLGGHPLPLLRRRDGHTAPVVAPCGSLLGKLLNAVLEDASLVLGPGETLIFYTDGFTEALSPDGLTQLQSSGLCEAVGGPRAALPLERCALEASQAVQRFTGKKELQDDQTLLLLAPLPELIRAWFIASRSPTLTAVTAPRLGLANAPTAKNAEFLGRNG